MSVICPKVTPRQLKAGWSGTTYQVLAGVCENTTYTVDEEWKNRFWRKRNGKSVWAWCMQKRKNGAQDWQNMIYIDESKIELRGSRVHFCRPRGLKCRSQPKYLVSKVPEEQKSITGVWRYLVYRSQSLGSTWKNYDWGELHWYFASQNAATFGWRPFTSARQRTLS